MLLAFEQARCPFRSNLLLPARTNGVARQKAQWWRANCCKQGDCDMYGNSCPQTALANSGVVVLRRSCQSRFPMTPRHQDNSGLPIFLFGLIVGAGVALLFAPVSGKETRRRLGE